MLGTDSTTELGPPPFETQVVPGKGRGLVARFDILKGTRIVCEQPFFTTPQLSPVRLLESTIATKLKTLSKTQQRQFLLLHNNFPGKHPFSGIVKTNALPCGPDSPIGGIYPNICLINHSCLPNAHNSWNPDSNSETIHAIRDISAGEEITISYDKGGPSASRRAHLRDAFGFDCACGVCSLSLSRLQISDNRRVQIQHLDDAIGDPDRVFGKPDACLADCYSLLQLFEEEFNGAAGALIARLYYDAFQISITHSDQARASIFARRAYESRVICEGQDNPATQRMKRLMENPAEHLNFGASTRWKTVKGLVPKGLDPEDFEKWLWRHAIGAQGG